MDRIVFSDDVHKNKLSNKEPECMKNQPRVDLSAPDLTNEEAKSAVDALVNKSFINLNFPKTVRMRVDPAIPQQNYYVFYFDPSPGAKPDNDGCFGVMKFRGAFATPGEAETHSEMLIRKYDSFHENIIGYVGREFPLTLDSKYCLSTKEVDIRSRMDKISVENIKSVREAEKQEKEEIINREKELLQDTSETKTYEDLDYYTQLRVKLANARILQEECERKIKEAGKIIKKTKEEINQLDESHPEYKNEYEARYRNAIENVGVEAQNNRMIQYMK